MTNHLHLELKIKTVYLPWHVLLGQKVNLTNKPIYSHEILYLNSDESNILNEQENLRVTWYSLKAQGTRHNNLIVSIVFHSRHCFVSQTLVNLKHKSLQICPSWFKKWDKIGIIEVYPPESMAVSKLQKVSSEEKSCRETDKCFVSFFSLSRKGTGKEKSLTIAKRLTTGTVDSQPHDLHKENRTNILGYCKHC